MITMNKRILTCTLACFAGSLLVAQADPKADASSAAKKLSAAASYSWISARKPDANADANNNRFRGGTTEGKTQKDGYTLISMPRGDTTFMAVIKGEKQAFRGQDGWQAVEAPSGDDAGGGGRGAFTGRMLRNFKAPAEQLQGLLAQCESVTLAEGAFSGTLNAEGARELMTFGRGRGGDNAPQFTGLKGSVKVWVKDGVVSKYEYTVQGSMNFNGNDREINRTTVVEIKDVGSTKVEIPEEAKKALS